MKKNSHSRPPFIDPGGLQRDEELRFKYDKNGNLVSVYKTRRYTGCFIWLILVAGAVVYFIFA